jgi:D-allulose-6-phosphate 3-epimerase
MRIHPAILVDNKTDLQNQMNKAQSFTDKVDIDILDWSRTIDKTVSVPEVLQAESGKLELYFDLMMDYPSKILPSLFSDKRVQMISLNLALKDDVYELIKEIREHGIFVGISVNPEGKLSDFSDLLELVENIQVMTVEPGKQGNPFLPERLELVNEIKATEFNGTIEVDGGINPEDLKLILDYPVDIVSVGSAISKAEDPEGVYRHMQSLIGNYDRSHSDGKLPGADLTE